MRNFKIVSPLTAFLTIFFVRHVRLISDHMIANLGTILSYYK